jgi:hypothetical protein
MIPDKTPTLAAIAWITVVMAYAWVSNRDYEDAVLARRSGLQTATPVGAPPSGRRTEPVPAGLAPGVAEWAQLPHPTLTGDRK